MRQNTRLTLAMLMAACLIGTTAACSSGPEAAPADEAAPEDVLEILDDALAGPTAGGDDDERVFGATQDMVITAVESTFASKNARATWAGDVLRVEMDGSVEEPTASIPCSALEALLADGESATIVFADGDLLCAERFD